MTFSHAIIRRANTAYICLTSLKGNALNLHSRLTEASCVKISVTIKKATYFVKYLYTNGKTKGLSLQNNHYL